MEWCSLKLECFNGVNRKPQTSNIVSLILCQQTNLLILIPEEKQNKIELKTLIDNHKKY